MRSIKVITSVFILIICLGQTGFCQKQSSALIQQKKIPVNFCISPSEVELYNMINEYRKSFSLPHIPFSRSLSFVAKSHVRDLFFNRPDQGKCNVHSWSDKGPWKPFCYPQDEKKNNSVWDKPKELSPYNSKAYEIVYWENNQVNIDSILPFWQSIDYFNSFLVNGGKWQGKTWMAIGVGIYENYASVWFGEIADQAGEPWICGQEPLKKAITEQSSPDSQEITKPSVENQQIQKVTSPQTGIPGSYYIIVMSQQPSEKSNRFLQELLSNGYKDAKVIVKDNKVRVSIMDVKDKGAADSALRVVRETYRDAWIYKEK